MKHDERRKIEDKWKQQKDRLVMEIGEIAGSDHGNRLIRLIKCRKIG
ncbi:hypothetical protein [Thioalkalivibrio sulfidiphilus]|nr:hypothetical protein [Thioalkalivibrio sulfidiphilus]